MDETNAFTKRERALEDEFFHRTDKALLEEMRQSMQRDQSRDSLATATGIHDRELLDTLLELGIQTTTLVALALVPPVFVAWSDETVSAEERDAIMQVARGSGIVGEGLAHQMLTEWLRTRPPKALWQTWERYVRTVNASLEPASRKALHDAILNQATLVAKASGGVLGIAKISGAEQNMLDDIQRILGD